MGIVLTENSALQYLSSLREGYPLHVFGQEPWSPESYEPANLSYMPIRDAGCALVHAGEFEGGRRFARQLHEAPLLRSYHRPLCALSGRCGLVFRNSSLVKTITRTGLSPSQALIDMGEISLGDTKQRIACTSPELTFLLMAHNLDLVGLALLGYELCGLYLLREDVLGGFLACRACMSPERLWKYIQRYGNGVRGRKEALRALRYVVPYAASPMESKIALLLHLPLRFGGFGVPEPKLNFRIDLSDSQRHAVKRHFFVLDLCWPKKKVAIEYNSDLYHSDDKRIVDDAEKITVLQSLGYTALPLTRSQIKSASYMHYLGMQLRRALLSNAHIRDTDTHSERYFALWHRLFCEG